MQREIKFRGKRVDNGELVYGFCEFHLVDGDLTQTKQTAFITYDSMDKIGKVYRKKFEVIPETVGQYTGLKDKNGKKIYEWDIVKVQYGNGYQTFEEDVQVIYDEYGFSPMNWQYECDGCSIYCEILEIEVIGNIYDNPELTEVANE